MEGALMDLIEHKYILVSEPFTQAAVDELNTWVKDGTFVFV